MVLLITNFVTINNALPKFFQKIKFFLRKNYFFFLNYHYFLKLIIRMKIIQHTLIGNGINPPRYLNPTANLNDFFLIRSEFL